MIEANPWLKIWTSPKITIQEIVNYNPKYRFGVLCFIYGLIWCLSMAQSLMLGHYYSIGFIYILSALLAVPIGFILLSISAGFFWIAGKLFKGKGTFDAIRAAVAWANVPSFATFFVWIILTVIYGPDIFISSTPDMNARFSVADFGMIIQAVLGIWGLVILIGGIAQVQKFSNWRSFGSVVIVSCLWLAVTVLAIYFLMMSSQSKVAMMFFAP